MRECILEKQAKIEEKPLRLTEVPTPQPKDDQIRIKILTCGVCRNDIHIAEGDLPLKKSPIILGHEIVGIVDEVGKNVKKFITGYMVGAFWLYSSCMKCKYCLSQRENYCAEIKCTGWDENGGYAEYMTISEGYALSLNLVQLEDFEIAPMLCKGIAGYAALRLTEAQKGCKLGLFGFGPTAYFALKIAKYYGIEVYVSTRTKKNLENAIREGASWSGNSIKEKMPYKLDCAIIFPPVGKLVEHVLSQLKKGGIFVLAPATTSQIIINEYSKNLWGLSIRTLYNLKKSEAEEFLKIAKGLNLKVEASLFNLEDLQDALILAKHGKLEQHNAVIKISE
ncbi:MAG: alcohol dehydrogenase catalytic domain-containing protein [Thermodesulfobacteriota bacterium]